MVENVDRIDFGQPSIEMASLMDFIADPLKHGDRVRDIGSTQVGWRFLFGANMTLTSSAEEEDLR